MKCPNCEEQMTKSGSVWTCNACNYKIDVNRGLLLWAFVIIVLILVLS